jgi:hypothetical protein
LVILVDEARWPWRGRRWAHLVSDASYDELHDFAARLGLPQRIFQGDHYDVPSELREVAIRLGAVPLDSRELVIRLRAAGLRLPASARPGHARAARHSATAGEGALGGGVIPGS